MRIMRVGERGREETVASLDGRAWHRVLDDGNLTNGTIAEWSEQIRSKGSPVVEVDTLRRGCPIRLVGKIVCVGLNYRRHAAEAGMDAPPEPILFLKAPDTIGGPDDPVRIPRGSTRTDYEVELAVIIGSITRYLDSPMSARECILGYTVSDDVSEREFQLERGGQWDKGKNCETFSPLGPELVTADEVHDPQDLVLSSSVNGETRQRSSTADMIFPVDELVYYISQFMTLYPGDVILTGTPEGVGAGFKPPRFLRVGDVVEVEIEGLGRQSHRLVAHDEVIP